MFMRRHAAVYAMSLQNTTSSCETDCMSKRTVFQTATLKCPVFSLLTCYAFA